MTGFDALRNAKVSVVEVGPRDGLQNEAARIDTADKVEFGAAKTAVDHAAEMATALINRTKP